MSEQNTKQGASGMAIAGLVLGIVAAISSWIPIINNFSFILALIGAVFAVVGVVSTMRGKHGGKGLAIAALVVNVIALALVLATQSAMSAAIDEATTPAVSTEDVQVQADGAGEAEADAEPAYSIADEAMTGDDYSVTITGTFTNNTDKDISYVQLSYRLLDAEGAQIETAYANTSDLSAGGTWKFEAGTLKAPEEIGSWERVEVTGF